jgi:hypothetical protein
VKEDTTLAKRRKKDYGTGVPDHEVEAIAECLLPAIRDFFESEEGQREFDEWKQKQAEKEAKGAGG